MLGGVLQARTDEVALVGVMVRAMRLRRHEGRLVLAFFFAMRHCALQCPAKAASAVLIDGLGHEQERPELEDGGANESCYSTAIQLFVLELGVWPQKRQQDEEGIDDPDHAADREDIRDVERYVPDRVVRKHAPEAICDVMGRRCRARSCMLGSVRGFGLGNDYGVSAFAIVARRPLEANVGSRIVAEGRSGGIKEGQRAGDATLLELKRGVVLQRFTRRLKGFVALHIVAWA
jgi:hypothetical protein